MKTIGHHACSIENGKEYVLENGPFFSKSDSKGIPPFLGEGYYYWDNNLELAHGWGKHRCGDYYIIESELNLKNGLFFDLVGNRSDMIHFGKLREKLKQYVPKGQNWTMGEFIEFLKELNLKDEYKGIFPYKVFRAVDLSRRLPTRFAVKFHRDKQNYTSLSPVIVICLVEKDKRILLNKSIIEN